MKVLDVGAQGIIIPNVHSIAQVDEIVSYAKYQPQLCRQPEGWLGL